MNCFLFLPHLGDSSRHKEARQCDAHHSLLANGISDGEQQQSACTWRRCGSACDWYGAFSQLVTRAASARGRYQQWRFPPSAAGGAAGIGRQLALDLVTTGLAQSVTVVDVDLAGASKVAAEIQRLGGSSLAVQADVSDSGAHRAAFRKHMERWGRLDYSVLNAGVAERGDVKSADQRAWNTTLDVNLRAVMEGVGLSAASMPTGGAILVVGSAGGIFPMPRSPVYSASKAGTVFLVRSLAEPLLKRGIGICCLCPQVGQAKYSKWWRL